MFKHHDETYMYWVHFGNNFPPSLSIFTNKIAAKKLTELLVKIINFGLEKNNTQSRWDILQSHKLDGE
jgi:hypothetical protein